MKSTFAAMALAIAASVTPTGALAFASKRISSDGRENIMKQLFAVLMALAMFVVPAAARADYPDRPITIVFPNQAGAIFYNFILAIVNEAGERIPQPVGIQPMPGAGTATGSRFVIEQPDDGYTLLFIHEGVIQVSILGMLGYDALEELEPLARVVQGDNVIWARADAPYNNLKELAEYANAHPGEIRFWIQTGAPSHVDAANLADTIGVAENIRLVHLTGGGAGARQGLIAEDVDIIEDGPSGLKGMLDAGQVKPLAFLGDERDPMLPDTPTLAEQGFVNNGAFSVSGYLWIRRSASQETKDFWRKALSETLNDPDVKMRLHDKFGLDFFFQTGPELEEFVKKTYDTKKGLIEKFNISMQ